MNREHPPCGACAKFADDHCTGHDRPAKKDDQPCVLFTEPGTWATRKAQQKPRFD